MHWAGRCRRPCRDVVDDCRIGERPVLEAVGEGFRTARVKACVWKAGALHASARDRSPEPWTSHSSERSNAKRSDNGSATSESSKSASPSQRSNFETSRLLISKCAWALDQGQRAGRESSIAEPCIAEAVGRIVNRGAQIYGNLCVSQRTFHSRAWSLSYAPSESATGRPKRTSGRSLAGPYTTPDAARDPQLPWGSGGRPDLRRRCGRETRASAGVRPAAARHPRATASLPRRARSRLRAKVAQARRRRRAKRSVPRCWS